MPRRGPSPTSTPWLNQWPRPAGVLDRDKQLGVVKELTEIVAAAAEDPSLVERTWVLITESPEGGWGINGHASTGADIAAAARAEMEQNAAQGS
jgi:phenylpyruvate tautomerase PptA (4-oxalocrotonate tautomerase family)